MEKTNIKSYPQKRLLLLAVFLVKFLFTFITSWRLQLECFIDSKQIQLIKYKTSIQYNSMQLKIGPAYV